MRPEERQQLLHVSFPFMIHPGLLQTAVSMAACHAELKITADPWPFFLPKIDHDCIKLYRWPIKIIVWPTKPEVLFFSSACMPVHAHGLATISNTRLFPLSLSALHNSLVVFQGGHLHVTHGRNINSILFKY